MSRNFIADREFRKIDEQIKREARENPDLRRRLQERKEKKENAKRIRMEILYSRVANRHPSFISGQIP